MQYRKLEDLIGKRVLHNILDARGVLLIAEGTVLQISHIDKLEKFNIDTFDIHVEPLQEQPLPTLSVREQQPALQYAPADTDELVKRTEAELQEIENFVRKNGKVPIADLEEKVLPAIMEAANKRNLFQLMSKLKNQGDFRYKHSISVTIVATMLGKWLQWDEQELSLLTTAASLYDIGSVMLPSDLLGKPSRFQPSEYEIMKDHTVLGYELLKKSGLDHRIALVALQHHEREDGSGYPNKLRGAQIDRLSKIIALADVYLALISERPHRPPFTFFEAISEIHKGIVGNRFDSLIGLTFLNRLMSMQIGSDVILSDERRGKIILINANYPASPLIAVNDECIDLSKTDSVKIKEIIG
jgi:putative nucleotidyltransferase with HDIG domain